MFWLANAARAHGSDGKYTAGQLVEAPFEGLWVGPTGPGYTRVWLENVCLKLLVPNPGVLAGLRCFVVHAGQYTG